MGLGQLTIIILIIAVLISAVVIWGFKRSENWLVTYLQSAVGALFIFSGWVKVADPMGTGFKLEQYFAEFQATFEGTWVSFIAPLFPVLSNYALAFSVVVIIFELLIGIMLIIGMWRKFTAWAFFLLVLFFTFLTAFTFLTGYVPSGTNFFQFSQWGPYNPSNMRVTDCGCFGDFIVIEPRVSFIKDLILLVPAILFLFFMDKMHQLFNAKTRLTTVVVAFIVLLIYAFSNFAWNLPHVDFRAFKENTDIRAQYNRELESAGNVEVVAWRLKNEETGQVVELSTDVYFAELGAGNYVPPEWQVLEQIQSEPEVPETKISDFSVNELDGTEITNEILEYPGHSIMIVAYNLPARAKRESHMVPDTLFVTDSIQMVYETGSDSLVIIERVKEIREVEEERDTYHWDDQFTSHFHERILPFVTEAMKEGVEVNMIVGEGDEYKIRMFQEDMGMEDINFYFADDILLKTIIRSSPGVVWWKDGTILRKWHKLRLPEFNSVKNELLEEN